MIDIKKTVVALGVALLTPTVSYAFCDNSSANSRLQVYCLSNVLSMTATNIGAAQILDYRLKQEGYARGIGLPGIVDQASFVPFVSPIIEYSSDINGGNPNRPLVLGSLTFFGDEKFFRKTGMVAGFGLGGSGRYIYGEGRYLDYTIGGSYTHSPEHDIGIGRSFANVCSKNDIGGNFYLDGCITTSRLNRDLADEATSSASLTVAKLFSDGENRFHQASFGLRHLLNEEYKQKQIIVKLDTLNSTNLYTSFSASFGEPVENKLAMRHSFSGTVGTTLLKKPISASLSYAYSDGGRLLGFSREEKTKTISITYAVHPRVNVSVGYIDTSGDIDYFNKSEAIFSIQFSPIRF
ncbi:MAG: hypothetical protein ACNA7O_12065 [Rhodobacterales bacterium]